MSKAIRKEFHVEKERVNWIDQGRGFLMVYLAIIALFPENLLGNNPITAFFFKHPSPKDAPWMNAYDVGVPAFFFIIGLLYSFSFLLRMRKKGLNKAVLYAILRWGLIYAAGLIIILLTRTVGLGEVNEIIPGVEMFVVSWDVIDSIGFVGLICIPFMFIPKKLRLIISYVMMTFYQAMLFIPGTYWREYALASVHGGILGGIFVLTPIVLIGSYIGEYYIMEKGIPSNEKNKKLAVFAAINLAIGLLLWVIPGGYPNKRMSTMSWAVISLAVIIVGMLVFAYADYDAKNYSKLNKANKFRITLFKAYGMNPLLIYILAAAPDLFEASLSTELQLIIWGVMLTAITIIAYALYRKNNVISTTKVTLSLIVILIVLAAILRSINFF
ncbi:hypothetical protein KAS14_07600 [Candidatus Bathyarchaeota archaeon]|nr:hypothetical protein [Candidatus Bathyarchaeota archaeon]